MSTPTAVADAELARILSDNEDYILSETKSQAVDLSKEMFQRCVISDSMMDQFSSLDHSRVDPKLQLRYLLRLVTQRIQEDGSVGDKFLSLLESMKEYPLCEYLTKSSSGKGAEPEILHSDDEFDAKDLPWISELLVDASPECNELAIALGLSRHQRLNVSGADNKKKLINIFDIWLSGGSTAPATINTLTQALSSNLVGHGRLAQVVQEKFKSCHKSASVPCSHIANPAQVAFTITNQSSRELQVEDGKSTLLMVQASHRENVSYQWNKNGLPLVDDYMYCGVHDNILVISHTHQGTGGEYTCCARREEREVVSNKMTLTVLYLPEKKQLLDLYSVNTHPLDDEWPPVRTETFISLVLVKSGVQTRDTRSYFANRITGKTDDIEYGEVFREYNGATLILVEGRPGSGKTTLVHKIIKDWAQGNVLVKANLIFLVSLRLLHCENSQNDTLCSILNPLYTNTRAILESLILDLERNNGEGVCFVFDGLDEYHPHMGDKSVVFRLLHKSYLPLAMIIVSSRPGAMARLRQAVVTQHIEVLGFTKNQVLKYIDKFPFDTLADSSLDPAMLKDYLRVHPNVFHMCYLPIHATIICFVYQTSRGHLPHTQTKIYEEFTRSLILRHLKRNNSETKLYSLKELPEDTREYFSKLCLLAFNMTVEHKQVINERDISFPLCEDTSPRGDWSLGLVTCNRTAQLCGVSTSYMFLHLTLQEYLAAYHIANTGEEEKGKLIEQIKTKAANTFESLWTFYFGLETFDSPSKLDYDILTTQQAICFRYAFESQQEIVCNEVVRLLNEKICISGTTFFFSLPETVFVISKTAKLIKELEFECIGYSEVLQQIRHVKFPELRTLFVMLLDDDKGTLETLSVILGSCTQLKHAELIFSNLSANGGKYLADTLQHFTKLEHFTLSNAYFPTDKTSPGLMAVLNQIQCLRQLNTLNIMKWNLDVNHCELLASNMCHLVNIEELSLRYNRISSEGVVHLTSALCHFTKLKILYLCCNNIGSDGAITLATALHHLTKLETLELYRNNIGSDGVSSLTSAMHGLTKLETLSLSDNVIGPDGAMCLASGLHVFTKLEALDLSDNNIGSEAAIGLASALHHHAELKYLKLSGNGIDVHSAIQVITALKDCQKLTWLTLNRSYYEDHDFETGVELCFLVAIYDLATVSKLIDAVRLLKQELDLYLGFTKICLAQ